MGAETYCLLLMHRSGGSTAGLFGDLYGSTASEKKVSSDPALGFYLMAFRINIIYSCRVVDSAFENNQLFEILCFSDITIPTEETLRLLRACSRFHVLLVNLFVKKKMRKSNDRDF